MARPTKAQENKKQFETFDDDALAEVAKFLNIEFSDSLTREEKIALLVDAKNGSLSIAKSAVLVDGKSYKCPLGYAVIKVYPKSGEGYGEWSKSTLFMNVQGDVCVARRGVPITVKDKYLHMLRDTKWVEHSSNVDDLAAAIANKQFLDPLSGAKTLQSEIFEVYAHNPDVEALEAAERELKENSIRYLKAKQQQQILKGTIFDKLTAE